MNKETLFLSQFNKALESRRTLTKLRRKDSLPDYHFTEIRCIILIEKLEEANVTKLSEAFDMTRGGVSKTTKKLLSYGAIESYRKPENKKEIYFKLTHQGKEIYDKYNELVNVRNDIDKAIFNEMDEKDKDIVIKFLEIYNERLEYHINKENQI